MGKVKGYAPYPVSYDTELNKRFHVITCDDCGTTDRMSTAASTGLPVLKIAKTFGNRGWDVDTKNYGHGTCGECQKKAKEAKKIRLVHSKPEPQKLEPAMFTDTKIPQPVIVQATAKADPPKEMGLDEMLLVLDAIETHYEPKTGYRDGYSDQKVADELNCPLAWVRNVRSKKFGHLPETPEIIALRTAIVGLATKIETLKNNIQFEDRAFHQRLENLRKDYNEAKERFENRTQSLKKQQDELTKQLEEAIAKL